MENWSVTGMVKIVVKFLTQKHSHRQPADEKSGYIRSGGTRNRMPCF